MGPRTERSPTLRIVLLLGVLAALLFWPVWIGRVPFPAEVVTQFPPWESVVPRASNPTSHAEMGDWATELYPWKVHTHRVVSSGEFPLWNPHLLLGAPFVGDPQTGLFYPANFLYFFLPTPLAWSLSFPLRAVLAGLGAALLARKLGATSGGSLLAGVVFAFSGWVTAFQARPHLDSCLWLPFILVAIDELQRKPSSSSIALAAAFFALPVLAGQPESAAHVTFVALAFFSYRALVPPKDAAPPAGRTRFVVLFAAAGLLAVGLAAVQILPALEFIGKLHRTLDVAWSAKPRHEILAFVSRDFSQNPNAAGVGIPEGAAYAGMLALLLAPLAVLHRNRRDAVFLAALLVVAVGIVYGLWPFFALSLRVPVLKGIPNGRLLAVADLALAVLAGLGLSALEEAPVEKRRRALAALLPGAALALSATAIVWMRSRGGAPVGLRGGPLSSLLFLAAAAVLVGLALWSRLPARTVVAVTVVFAAADLLSAVSRLF
ncbi:MAG TPA: YfhO family protein, partial [Thermoanaerobaculia bacterium]|nr:YfhO family protein [Thermoanaerobaculia bacterium]